MYLGRVMGRVVCNQSYPGMEGLALRLVQPLDHQQSPVGTPEVAVDTVHARDNDLVYLVGSREASQALENSFVPVDSAIVGIVDEVDLSGGARE